MENHLICKIIKKMKFKNMFLIMFGIWILDIITTFICLVIYDGFAESNNTAKFFFDIGWMGWILWIFVGFTIIFTSTYFIYYITEIIKNKTNVSDGSIFFVKYIFVGLFFTSELMCIINNISLFTNTLMFIT